MSDWSSDVCSSDLAPREDLNRAADFLVAADDGIELAAPRILGQVAGEFLERVIAILGRRRVGAAPAAQRVDRSVEGFGGRARSLERLARRGVERQRQRNQQPLDGDVAVASLRSEEHTSELQ